MITITYRSGKSETVPRETEMRLLMADNSREWRKAIDLSPGVLVEGRGLVIWLETDGQRQCVPAMDRSQLPVRRMEIQE